MINKDYKLKINRQELPRISDRVSFIYIEKSKINRLDGAITARDYRGVVKIPAACIGLLMLGPGTDISHRAIELLGDIGTSLIWVGEQGVRNYANGRPLARTTRLLEQQAKLVSNNRSRLAVARKMYSMRFANEDVSKLTMQQLRGREGSRIRAIYRKYSKQYGVNWDKRSYKVDNFEASDSINKALSAANVCLYGICQSIIQALGMSSGLGFIHTGHDKSFVYDIADLYKADLSIPLAFKIVSKIDEKDDIGQITRLAMRDKIKESQIVKKICRDLQKLMDVNEEDIFDLEIINLWDDKLGHVNYGINYEEEI